MRRQKLSPKQRQNQVTNERDGFRSRRNTGQQLREKSLKRRKSSPSRILSETRASRWRRSSDDYTGNNDCEPTPCPPCPPCLSTLDETYEELKKKYTRKAFELADNIEQSRKRLDNFKKLFFSMFKYVNVYSSDYMDNEEEFNYLFENLKNVYDEITVEIGKRDKLEIQAEAIANIFSREYDRKKYEKKKENLLKHLEHLFIQSLIIKSKYENKNLESINSERRALVSVSTLAEETKEEMRESLPTEVETLQTSIQEIDNTLNTTTEEAVRLIEINLLRENEIKELQKQLESTSLVEKNRLESTISALEQQNLEMTAREASLSRQVNTLITEKDTLKNELEEKQRLLSAVSLETNINEAIIQKDQEILRLKLQNEKLEEDITKLKTSSTSTTEQPPVVIPVVVTDEKFVKYKKMQEKGIPEGAIRQKMGVDEVSSADIYAFFNPSTPPPPPPVTDERFIKYKKMQEMGVPEPQIKHKMKIAGISPDDINVVFPPGDAEPGVSPKPLVITKPKNVKVEQNDFEKKQQLAIDNFLQSVGIEEEAKKEVIEEEVIEEVKIITKKDNMTQVQSLTIGAVKKWFIIVKNVKNDTEELAITDKFEMDAKRIDAFIEAIGNYEGEDNELLKLKQQIAQIKSIILIIKDYNLINASLDKEIAKFDELKKWMVVKNDYEICRVDNNKLFDTFKNETASILFMVNDKTNNKSIKASALAKFFDESSTIDKRIFSTEYIKIKYNFSKKPDKILKPEEVNKSKLEALVMATNSGQETYTLDTFKASCDLSGSKKINELIAKNQSLSESIITKLNTFFTKNHAELLKIQKHIDDYNTYIIDTDEEQIKTFLSDKFSKPPSIKIYIENCQKVIKEVSTEFPNDFFSVVGDVKKLKVGSNAREKATSKDILSALSKGDLQQNLKKTVEVNREKLPAAAEKPTLLSNLKNIIRNRNTVLSSDNDKDSDSDWDDEV